MSMTTDIIGNPRATHVCPCGCGRLVGPTEYWTPSPNPREDVEATVEGRIAEATARVVGRAEELRARWERVMAETRADVEKQVAALPRVDCPCCRAEFMVDEYREHVAEGSTFTCDRERWGSAWIDSSGGDG
jgi:hypothetical protein